jgi:hypothetical protein
MTGEQAAAQLRARVVAATRLTRVAEQSAQGWLAD